MPDLFMVFDVESIGLHGEGFAVGWVVVDGAGKELEAEARQCWQERADGCAAGRKWVMDNVPLRHALDSETPATIRTAFWNAWPVEARFLAACVDDKRAASDDGDGPRAWEGPYPLVDVASVLLAKGIDPLAKHERRKDELPEHCPLADARQSARLLIEALARNNR